jgi:hypothetical protein
VTGKQGRKEMTTMFAESQNPVYVPDERTSDTKRFEIY